MKPSAAPRRAVVVGGGISGLTVAWHLHRAGVPVTLIEVRAEVGGSVETERRDGFLLEKGPFNVIVRDPAFEELLTGLSDRVRVVSASDEASNRYIYRHGGLIAVPTGPLPFLTTPLLSFAGRIRALRGLLISSRGRKPETTIEEFAARRFGQEVADTLVSAAVAGILAGDIRKLNAYAAFPVLREFDQHSLSPLGRTLRRLPAIIRKRRNPQLGRKWKGLVSIDRGLGGLCDAIADEIGAGVWKSTRVTGIGRSSEGWHVVIVRNGATECVACSDLILATPAHETARLLGDVAPQVSADLQAVESSSLTVVNLGFRKSDVAHPLDGFGFLVPHNEPNFPLMGTLFADSAFPHHAPPDCRLLRVFFGGTRWPDVLARSADELVRTACTALGEVLGVRGTPVLVDVCPYPNALPQYYLDHPQRVTRIRAGIAPLSGLHLAGNYLDGVSMNDCVKLGKQVAADVQARVPQTA